MPSPSFNHRLRVIEPYGPGGLLMSLLARRREREPERTGLHCSSIVNDLMATLYPRKPSPLIEAARLPFQEIGNVIEDVCAAAFMARNPEWVKPAPRTFRKIICSPDGWHPVTKTLDEIKATWVTPREFLDSPKFHGYLLQSLLYALAWGAERLRVHVVFVCGTGRPPFPEAHTYVVRWDDTDALEHNYQILHQHADDRGMYEAA